MVCTTLFWQSASDFMMCQLHCDGGEPSATLEHPSNTHEFDCIKVVTSTSSSECYVKEMWLGCSCYQCCVIQQICWISNTCSICWWNFCSAIHTCCRFSPNSNSYWKGSPRDHYPWCTGFPYSKKSQFLIPLVQMLILTMWTVALDRIFIVSKMAE